uniref:Peptidyl-prolyl cis-trans isomerase n=1 Tax=Chaetoceros debilis TaxID=122233 RepID=A0A6S8VG61_9STRA|mmetsp:Transcript_17064/g.25090  ORF Transcript_17064/g.25090 Transcript_17064/m.25090 type:complete len:224 (+) Transcript_17064:534-1205(+)
MGNSGKNSNTSQFFIAFKEAPQCDGKHVVFGEMVSGFDVLEGIENQGVEGSMSGDGKPSKEVKITDCGAFHPLMTAGAGFWYDQPDVDSFTGKTPVFMVRPRIAIIAATRAICDKFITMLGTRVTSTSIAIDSDGVGSEDIAVQMAHALVQSFAIDVILVAPTNRQAFEKFEIPSSWIELSPKRAFNKEEVCLISKPIDALFNIQNQSWIGKESSYYHLDGKI